MTYHGHKAAKERYKAVNLQNYPNDWPSKQKYKNSTQEAGSSFYPLHSAKKTPSSLKADTKDEASDAEKVPDGEQAFVKEHENSKEKKEHPKTSKSNPQFLLVTYLDHFCNKGMLIFDLTRF